MSHPFGCSAAAPATTVQAIVSSSALTPPNRAKSPLDIGPSRRSDAQLVLGSHRAAVNGPASASGSSPSTPVAGPSPVLASLAPLSADDDRPIEPDPPLAPFEPVGTSPAGE